MGGERPDAAWVVVIPVKPAAVGKSRLFAAPPGGARGTIDGAPASGAASGGMATGAPASSAASGGTATGAPAGHAEVSDARASLARAIAMDTIAAAVAVCPVVVVTDDGITAAAARTRGARVVPEGAPAGLNAAIGVGVAAAEAAFPGAHRAALLGDLPALRASDLADALRQAASVPRAVVADAEGTGSTLVTARAGVPWSSAFGPESLRRHVARGCTVLNVPAGSTLRRDVDTPEQLRRAMLLGLGSHTSALMRPAATRR